MIYTKYLPFKILKLIFFVSLLHVGSLLSAQNVIINEVSQDGQWVELYNASTTTTTNVSDWFLCNFPIYNRISAGQVTVLSGSTNMPPNSYLVLSWGQINTSSGEVGLYHNTTTNFGDASKIRDYMQYGSGNHQRAGLATGQGIWDNASSFVPNRTTNGNSLVMTDQTAQGPADTDSTDWSEGPPTQGSSNFPPPCPALLTLNDDPITPDTYRATMIESAGRIANNGAQQTILLGEESVQFNINFVVDNGGLITASIEDCPN